MSYTEVKEESVDLEDIWRERARELLEEKDENTTRKTVQTFRELVSRDPKLTLPQDNEFYLRFLRAGRHSPPAAADILHNYFTLKNKHPLYFKSSLAIEEIIKSTFSAQIHAMLPQRDSEGRRIYVFRPGKWNPDKIPFHDIFCAGYILCEMVIREERTQIAGLTAICDANGFGWKQLRGMGLDDARSLATFFNISFPVWLRQTHVLNAPRFFDMVFNVVGPLMSESARKEVVFHSGDLHTMKNYFRSDILPSDLGGTAPAVNNSQNCQQLRELEGYFRQLDELGYATKQRN